MKLGLGLSIPGVATMGGNQAERILSTAKHLYDARRGSAWTDYGSGATNGAATGTTHSGNWWTFNGTTDRVQLWANGSVPMGVSDGATFAVVLRRTSASAPAVIEVPLSYKQSTTAAGQGFRLAIDTSGNLSAPCGDGTNSVSPATTGVAFTNSTVRVVTLQIDATTITLRVNGVVHGSTSRGSVGSMSPSSVAARAGANASASSQFFAGDIAVIAAWTTRLSDSDAVALANLTTIP